MPRGHDVVHVPPQLLVRVREVPVLVFHEEHRVQETVLFEDFALRLGGFVRVAAALDYLLAHDLERVVRLDELPQSSDPEPLAELQQRERDEDHLAHDLRAPVVRLEHLVRFERAYAGDDVARLPEQVERVIERDGRYDVQEQVLRVQVHVLREPLLVPGHRRGHVPRVAQVPHAALHHRAERLEKVGVDERLLAHLAVLPVVLALTPRHPQVFQHDAKHVRQEPVAVIRRVRLAHVLHRPRVDRGDAPRTERVHDADGVAVVVLVPVEHRGWHPDRVADRLLQRVQEHLVL
mmetsp:Transcript_5000/g.17865  ORF Transcript_5000/g.17865 Transcript_5000/m.17865 type:complete len:292 (-) Transcript_5000:312-1187(-)